MAPLTIPTGKTNIPLHASDHITRTCTCQVDALELEPTLFNVMSFWRTKMQYFDKLCMWASHHFWKPRKGGAETPVGSARVDSEVELYLSWKGFWSWVQGSFNLEQWIFLNPFKTLKPFPKVVPTQILWLRGHGLWHQALCCWHRVTYT